MRVFLVLLLALLGALGGLNFTLDPFLAHRVVEIDSLRRYRDTLHTRIAKAEILAHEQCSVVIVGTSRAQMALDPESSEWGSPACNLALTGAGLAELLGVFEHVLLAAGVREIVVALDLQAAPRVGTVHEEFLRSRFAPALQPVEYQGALLLGEDATRASFRLLSDFWSERASPYTERGFTNPALRGETADRASFLWALRRTIESMRAPRRDDAASELLLFDRLALAIRAARSRGIAVTVVVLPSHAIFLETMHRAGRWPAIEHGREAFQRAISAGGAEPAVPVWDFTSWLGTAAEEVPAKGATTEMRWHWDAVHAKPEVGEEVIAQIRHGESPRHISPGVRLSVDSLDGVHRRLRREREQYLRDHGSELVLIDEAEGGARD